MRGRSSGRGADRARAALFVFNACLCAPAGAQFLDLDRPQPPVLESPTASDLLAAELAREVEGIARATSISPRDEARIALRRFASDLLALDGPARLWGLTIASQRALLDDVLTREVVPESVAIFLRRDLDVPRFDLPRGQADLDRMIRDAFAELAAHADEPQRWGWESPIDPPAQDVPAVLIAWEAQGILSEATRSEITVLLESAASWAAFARPARALARRVLKAGAILDVRGDLPDDAQAACEALLARAIEGLLRPELRDEALAELDALASLADLLLRAGTLRSRQSRDALRSAAAQSLISRSAGGSTPPLGLAQSILAQIARGDGLPSEEAIVRPLRPAWRVAVARVADARDRQIDLLPRVLSAPLATSDPAIVAPLGAFQRLLDDAEMILDASDALRDTASPSREPVVREDRRQLATRLLALGQQLSDIGESEHAMDELRRFAREASLAQQAGEFPAGDDLSNRLLARSRESASAWIQAWSSPDDEDARERHADSAETLSLLAQIAGHMRDLRALGDDRTARSLDAWPGVEISPTTLQIVIAQAPQRLAQTAEILLEPDLPRTRDRLESYAQEYRVLTLLATLHRELGERDASVYEIVSGAPDAQHALARRRGELAELSLLLEEIPAARYRNDPGDERDIRRYANASAENLLADLAMGETGR